jgi:pimeloyl-ACP methyl ester carboxylesterase
MPRTETLTSTQSVSAAITGTVEVTLSERGVGRSFLVLHGGGGLQTVSAFADLLAGTRAARVITPTHPGFAGTPRPGSLATIRDLALLYVALLEELDLSDVTVVGNSIGGWVAAEIALAGSDRVSGVVLVDAAGIEVPGHPVTDFFSLTMDQLAQRAYYNPDKFRIDPTTLPPAAQAAMAANRAALAAYAGTAMSDPSLLARLGDVAIPVLVVWGEADQMVDQEYGRAYAAAIPGAQFVLLKGTGHLPQMETPDQLLPVVWDFAAGSTSEGAMS